MQADFDCYGCITKKMQGLLSQYPISEERKIARIKDIYMQLGRAEPSQSAPVLMADAIRLIQQEWNEDIDLYAEAKEKYNADLMRRKPALLQGVQRASDPLYAALQLAMTGNYIDFGAMDEVDDTKLEQLLCDWEQMEIDRKEYQILCSELNAAQRLVYLCDNAGEIVLDSILVQRLRQQYPQLHITVVTRGKPILNDALRCDAIQAGMEKDALLLDNGEAIPGTQLERLPQRTREAMESADLCIAKGQGNFETLHGCGKNIYYLFLCKCSLFTRRFGVRQFYGLFCNEKRM